ncbi:MAE_28990/MAE_18760 family HEPN-like nuclease [Aeromonas dhakensis]|uniref:MAE_28990/MAE_18760 family HEPN-like nuclease n=1 Tax=Aeromonas dhakensis TaxID=196024 RepID=UPI00244D2B06|nr:MAE_28990/MAE_18760 family HEPN-like nuclease [Aeromonas dhakensis]MDH0349080.1 MAE_28990/MAE_18760 family HEPN-like nuclease [Aeromonas dhakensis]
MPLSIVRSNSRGLFNEVLVNLSFIESMEPQGEAPITIKILRGLFYVHLYSALEKAVNETVDQVILIIKNNTVKNKHFTMHLNIITLHSKMQSFKECGYKEYFKKSYDIFNSIDSEESFEIIETVFSSSLQNVWFNTIQEIIDSFGAEKMTIHPRVRYTIDEIVEKRNAVAHGRESPTSVGERHRCEILRKKTQEIQLFVEEFISTFENYITDKKYLKPDFIDQYP